MFLMLCIILSAVHNVIGITWIERTANGDRFDVTCSTCHLYGAVCETLSIFSCCTSCRCSSEYTLFNGLCRADLNHHDLVCEFFTSENRYYGLKTTKFFTSLTDVGYIYRDDSWSHTEFFKCEFDGVQKYWDTQSWVDLFTNGRTKDDFYFDGDSTGVMVKFFGTTRNQPLYSGLLIKLRLACYSYFGGKINSCLVLKVAGMQTYNDAAPSTISPTTKSTAAMTTTTRTISSVPFPNSTTKTKQTTTAHVTKHQTTPVTRTHSPTSSSSKHGDKTIVQIVKEVLPFVGAVLFLVFFCALFLCCKIKRGRTASKIHKVHLLATEHPSYSGDSSCEIHESLVTSCEFEFISLPTYSDVQELKLDMVSERKRAPSGIYYVNAITEDGKLHSVNSAMSDDSETNNQTTSDNIFLVDGNT